MTIVMIISTFYVWSTQYTECLIYIIYLFTYVETSVSDKDRLKGTRFYPSGLNN